MARITAKQAYTRARAKLDKTREQKATALMESRIQYRNRLSNMGIIVRGGIGTSTPKHEAIEGPINAQSSSVKRRRKTSVTNNKKITDYYSRQSRGRENIPKRRSLDSGSEVEIITLGESDDEQSLSSDFSNCTNNNTLPRTPEVVLKPEPIDTPAPPGLETSFADLNVSKIVMEEDLEIVEMLPPIPLRKHSVIDLEED